MADNNAFEAIKNQFIQYGLESLVPKIQEYLEQGITDAATLILMLRQTPEYQRRFPAMAALNQKGVAITEADYINYERNAGELEQRFALPKGFLTDPTRIQQMLENDVSASELSDRVQLNAAAAYKAPQEVRNAMRDLYGLDETSLAAYYLDPDNAVPYLEKQYAAANVAGYAARQRIMLDRSTAEMLAEQGVTADQADQGFQQVAGLTGLSSGQGEQATQSDLIGATFGDAAAREKVQRVSSGRTAEFKQGGGAATGQSGVTGLGQG